MTDRHGRCTNLELCSAAVSQRTVTLASNVAFVCPNCGERLEEIARAAPSVRKNRAVLAVQAAVILTAGAGLAYKLLIAGVSNADSPIVTAESLAAAAPATAPAPAAAIPGPMPMPAPTQGLTPIPAMALTPAAPATQATPLLQMAGSDVVAGGLARRLASGYLALIGDSDITAQPGEGSRTLAIVGNQAGQHEAITIAAGSSASGFAALMRGTADVAMSVRPPTQDEVEHLASVVDLTSPANEHVVAVDAVVAIVSPASRLAALTVPQLQAVFTGKLRDWSQLGSAPGQIHAVIQNGADGSTDSAADLVLGGAPAAANVTRVASEADVARRVASDHLAIGLVSRGHEGTAHVLAIAAPGAAPIEATDLTISTEDYPLTRRITLYGGSASGNAVARRFVDYAASASGQAAVEAAGFTALTLRAAPVAVPTTSSDRFRALTADTTRVSVDFRFQPASIALDSRAARDIDRLAAFLRAQHADGARLVLAGFADASGSQSSNQVVSQRRVEAVVAALSKSGVAPGRAVAFGSELPVADNATPEGRERNRRVEVYLVRE